MMMQTGYPVMVVIVVITKIEMNATVLPMKKKVDMACCFCI